MSSFNSLSFALAYHTLHIYGLYSLSQSLWPCCLFKCVPLVDLLNCLLWAEQISCHQTPIPCTWDSVTTFTSVTVFFLYWVRLGSKKKIYKFTIMVLITYPSICCVVLSYLTNKIINHFNTGKFSCQMQGSHLIVKNKVRQKAGQCTDSENKVDHHWCISSLKYFRMAEINCAKIELQFNHVAISQCIVKSINNNEINVATCTCTCKLKKCNSSLIG